MTQRQCCELLGVMVSELQSHILGRNCWTHGTNARRSVNVLAVLQPEEAERWLERRSETVHTARSEGKNPCPWHLMERGPFHDNVCLGHHSP